MLDCVVWDVEVELPVILDNREEGININARMMIATITTIVTVFFPDFFGRLRSVSNLHIKYEPIHKCELF